MRPDWRWILVPIVALAGGAFAAKPYARLAAPYYHAVAQILAQGRPWQIASVEVGSSASSPGAVLRLTGYVREFFSDVQPAAKLVGKLQVSAVIESPLIFWSLLLAWPAAGHRQRLARLALGIPVFLLLEAGTTVCQLLNPLAYASAVLAGDPDPVTSWEHWSRFLEAGGRVALAIAGALVTIGVSQFVVCQGRNAVAPRGSRLNRRVDPTRRSAGRHPLWTRVPVAAVEECPARPPMDDRA